MEERVDRWMDGPGFLGNPALVEREIRTGKWSREFTQLLA